VVGKVKDLEKIIVTSTKAKGASMKVLVSPNEGWEDYVMRLLEVEPGGYTPKHSHPWPHINYIVKGNGELFIDGVTHEVKTGSYAFVPGNKTHQFRNAGKEVFQFICIVPKEGHIV